MNLAENFKMMQKIKSNKAAHTNFKKAISSIYKSYRRQEMSYKEYQKTYREIVLMCSFIN
jgi:hypothetical protein